MSGFIFFDAQRIRQSTGSTSHNRYATHFRSCSDQQLVDAFNAQVTDADWGAARTHYLDALRSEFSRRQINIDAIRYEGGSSLCLIGEICLDGAGGSVRLLASELMPSVDRNICT